MQICARQVKQFSWTTRISQSTVWFPRVQLTHSVSIRRVDNDTFAVGAQQERRSRMGPDEIIDTFQSD